MSLQAIECDWGPQLCCSGPCLAWWRLHIHVRPHHALCNAGASARKLAWHVGLPTTRKAHTGTPESVQGDSFDHCIAMIIQRRTLREQVPGAHSLHANRRHVALTRAKHSLVVLAEVMGLSPDPVTSQFQQRFRRHVALSPSVVNHGDYGNQLSEF